MARRKRTSFGPAERRKLRRALLALKASCDAAAAELRKMLLRELPPAGPA